MGVLLLATAQMSQLSLSEGSTNLALRPGHLRGPRASGFLL